MIPSEDQKKQVQDQILQAETTILKTTGFALSMETAYRYVDRYCKLLYPSHPPLKQVAMAVCNDQFFTYASLLFKNQSIALACIIFAAMRENQQLPYEAGFKFPADKKAEDGQSQDKRAWYLRIDEQIDVGEVTETLNLIEEYYNWL